MEALIHNLFGDNITLLWLLAIVVISGIAYLFPSVQSLGRGGRKQR